MITGKRAEIRRDRREGNGAGGGNGITRRNGDTEVDSPLGSVLPLLQ